MELLGRYIFDIKCARAGMERGQGCTERTYAGSRRSWRARRLPTSSCCSRAGRTSGQCGRRWSWWGRLPSATSRAVSTFASAHSSSLQLTTPNPSARLPAPSSPASSPPYGRGRSPARSTPPSRPRMWEKHAVTCFQYSRWLFTIHMKIFNRYFQLS